jgi:hypothetical protein
MANAPDSSAPAVDQSSICLGFAPLLLLLPAACILQVGAQIWSDMLSGAAEEQPQLLQRFLLLVHGDLKHFVFTYWWVGWAWGDTVDLKWSQSACGCCHDQSRMQWCAASVLSLDSSSLTVTSSSVHLALHLGWYMPGVWGGSLLIIGVVLLPRLAPMLLLLLLLLLLQVCVSRPEAALALHPPVCSAPGSSLPTAAAADMRSSRWLAHG